MRSRGKDILPWAVCLSLIVHAAILVGFSVSPARSPEIEKYYRVQLVDIRGDKGSELQRNRKPAPKIKKRSPQRKVKKRKSNYAIKVVKRNTVVEKAEPARSEKPVETTPVAQPPATKQESPAAQESPPAETSAPLEQGRVQQVASRSDFMPPGDSGAGRAASQRKENKNWEKAYRRKVYSKIRRAKRYPYSARRAGMEGRVVVRFTVLNGGTVTSVSISKTSPYAVLNSDAKAWIRRAAPFPPFPPDADRSSMTFSYGLTYDLK